VRKIALLDKSHDREGFDCGSEPLNLFLKQTFLPVKAIQEALTIQPHLET